MSAERRSGSLHLLAVVGPALVVLALGVLAYRGVQRTMDGMEEVAEAHRASVFLEDVLSRLIDAETAERGFIVTGDERFLEPYLGVREDMITGMDSLRTLLDEPAQRERLEGLASLADAKLDWVEHNIALRRSGGVEAAQESVRSGEGKARMDAARHAIAEIEQVQLRSVAAKQADLQARTRGLGAFLFAGSLLAVLLGVLTNLLLIRRARARDALAADLGRKNALLQNQATELEAQAEELQEQAVQLEEAIADLEASHRELRLAHATLEERDAERGALLEREHEARRQAEESEQRFRSLANSIPQLAWMADHAGWIFWYNERWYDYTGTTLEQMRGWGWTAVHHPEHVRRVEERIRQAFETGEPWEDTFPLRGSDGEFRWFLSRALPIRDAEGRVVRWFGTNTDVTEQLEYERALRESEENTRFLAETIPHMVWITRPDGYHEFYNQRWFDYTGLTRDDSAGEGWSTVLHPDDRERARDRWRHSLETGEPYTVEYRFRSRDGEHRWFLGLALPLRDEGGRIVRWFGTCTDIHDRKVLEAERERLYRSESAARAALAERTAEAERREAELSAVLEHLPAAVWISDQAGRILRVNPGTAHLYGDAPMSESADAYVQYEAYWPAGHPRAEQRLASREWALARSLATGETIINESLEIARFDTGERRQVLNSTAAIRDCEGRITGGVAVMFDVTEQEGTRRALEAARAEAEEANRVKMDFLSAMSHELRTPLNAIAGFVDLMELGVYGENSDGQIAALERIRKNQQSLLVLINDILQYAKIEAGRLEIHAREINVAELFRELTGVLEPQARRGELALTVEQCDPSVRVWADPDRLRQILLNLLGNAVKFTPPGGRVSLSCEAGPRHIEIHVADTGRGIPADMVQKIFDPFVQVGRSRSELSLQGVGLGLAISRDLAQAMGGTLAARSTLGDGSTFTLVLPAPGDERRDGERRSGDDRRCGEERRTPDGVAC